MGILGIQYLCNPNPSSGSGNDTGRRGAQWPSPLRFLQLFCSQAVFFTLGVYKWHVIPLSCSTQKRDLFFFWAESKYQCCGPKGKYFINLPNLNFRRNSSCNSKWIVITLIVIENLHSLRNIAIVSTNKKETLHVIL